MHAWRRLGLSEEYDFAQARCLPPASLDTDSELTVELNQRQNRRRRQQFNVLLNISSSHIPI